MATIRIDTFDTLPRLVQHFVEVVDRIDDELDKAARDTAREGNRTAQRFAIRSSGVHGKHYPRAFTVERRGIADFIYGPEAGMPQGGMSFENGSRNQPPHRDLARSADTLGPKFVRRVGKAIDRALG